MIRNGGIGLQHGREVELEEDEITTQISSSRCCSICCLLEELSI